MADGKLPSLGAAFLTRLLTCVSKQPTSGRWTTKDTNGAN
jgi:hypothetical protein